MRHNTWQYTGIRKQKYSGTTSVADKRVNGSPVCEKKRRGNRVVHVLLLCPGCFTAAPENNGQTGRKKLPFPHSFKPRLSQHIAFFNYKMRYMLCFCEFTKNHEFSVASEGTRAKWAVFECEKAFKPYYNRKK